MRAVPVPDSQDNFTRGGDPYKKLKVGDHRSIEDVVNARIQEEIPESGYKFADITEYINDRLENEWTVYDAWNEVDEIIKHTPVQYQSDWYWKWLHEWDEYINESMSQDFTRGGDPYEKFKIGNHRPLDVLVDERIKETKEQDKPDYLEIREYLAETFNDMSGGEVLELVDDIMKHTSTEYQVSWWVSWHPTTI